MARDFWPCVAVHTDGGALQSIIFTEFQRLDRKHPKYATSGYAVERLVKQLARVDNPKLLKRVKFDPEADMFCAYGDDADALFEIATIIRKATGQKKPPPSAPAQLAPDAARAALRKGFVLSLDETAQQEFLRGWPRPCDPAHEALERELKSKEPKTRLTAARRLTRAACRVIGNLHQPLTHPKSFDAVSAALEKERDPKIADELVFALAMMCSRALPDQRMQPVLESYLASPRWRVRWSAVDGLAALHSHDWAKLVPLLDDPHEKVRAAVCRAAWSSEHTICSWAIGDPEPQIATPFPEEHVAKLRTKLKDKACAQFVKNFLQTR
jgi:hypothetical protein